ncbi:hypothetical protein [Paraburkholderia phytofirmans]|uniref:hypothetical protein n=1 Tax=Paraburkholderia TaxID=1822464 RepID=UPI000AFF97BD|nr:hypothetical protein [Paraburkholderia phytofirmans]
MDTTTSPLLGLMMDVPLTVSSLIAHAARHFGDTEIVSRRIEGDSCRRHDLPPALRRG